MIVINPSGLFWKCCESQDPIVNTWKMNETEWNSPSVFSKVYWICDLWVFCMHLCTHSIAVKTLHITFMYYYGSTYFCLKTGGNGKRRISRMRATHTFTLAYLLTAMSSLCALQHTPCVTKVNIFLVCLFICVCFFMLSSQQNPSDYSVSR